MSKIVRKDCLPRLMGFITIIAISKINNNVSCFLFGPLKSQKQRTLGVKRQAMVTLAERLMVTDMEVILIAMLFPVPK